MKPVTDASLIASLDAAPVGAGGVGGREVKDPHLIGQLEYGIDFKQPVEAVRAQIAKLPEANRDRALTAWADAFVADERAQADKSVLGGAYQAGSDIVRGIARGAPIIGQLADEGSALISSAQHAVGLGGAPYDEALAYNRAQDRAFDRSAPLASFAAQMGGGVAPIAALARPATTVLGNVGRGAQAGAVYGATAGFGAGEGGLGNRLGSAGQGAAAGAVIGAALPAAVAGVRGGYQRARDAVMPQVLQRTQGPDAAAEYIMARRMGAAGTNPTEVGNALADAGRVSRFGSNSFAPNHHMIADTSDDMQRLTGTIYRGGGEAAAVTRNALESRQRGPANPYSPQPGEPAGQLDDLLNSASRAMQIRIQDTGYATVGAIRAQQAQQGRQLYAQAYADQSPIDLSGAMTAARNAAAEYTGPFRARLERAIRLFENNGTAVTNVRRFDNAKKQLDDMIESAQRSGQGNMARELTVMKNNMFDAVHQPSNGAATRHQVYDEARRTWATSAEAREAVEMGRTALNEASEMTADAFRALTPAQQQLFRVGFQDALRRALSTKRSSNDGTVLFNQRRVQEIMSEVVPTTRGSGVFADRQARFGDYVANASTQNQTRQRVLGGSQTAERLNDDARGTRDMLGSALQAMRGGTSWILEGAVHLLDRMAGFNQNVSLSMARMLTSTNPQEQARALAAIHNRMNEQQFRVFTDQLSRLTQAGAGASAGVAAGSGGGR